MDLPGMNRPAEDGELERPMPILVLVPSDETMLSGMVEVDGLTVPELEADDTPVAEP